MSRDLQPGDRVEIAPRLPLVGRPLRWPHNNDVSQRHTTHNNDPHPDAEPSRAAFTPRPPAVRTRPTIGAVGPISAAPGSSCRLASPLHPLATSAKLRASAAAASYNDLRISTIFPARMNILLLYILPRPCPGPCAAPRPRRAGRRRAGSVRRVDLVRTTRDYYWYTYITFTVYGYYYAAVPVRVYDILYHL